MSAPLKNQNAAKADGEKSTAQLFIRAKKADKLRWKRAAKLAKAANLTQWATDCLNMAAGKK